MDKLDAWKKQIDSLEKMRFCEAKKLYEKAIETDNLELRENYINRIVMGTLYVCYDYVVDSGFDIISSGAFDIDDIMNSTFAVWNDKIRKGYLLKVPGFANIVQSYDFARSLRRNVCGHRLHCIPTGVNADYFADILAKYIVLKEKNMSCSVYDVINNDLRSKKYNTDIVASLIEGIYSMVFDACIEKKKCFDLTTLRDTVKMFLEMTLFEYKTVDYQSDDNMEDRIIYDMEMKNFSLDELFNNLSQKQRDIIYSLYGFDGKVKTLSEVGEVFDMTAEGVRLAEERALNKMFKHCLRDQKYKDMNELNYRL